MMDINVLRLLAFRYSLGRASYATYELADELIANWDDMQFYQMQIHADIKRAILHGKAGHAQDVAQWRRILKLKVTK